MQLGGQDYSVGCTWLKQSSLALPMVYPLCELPILVPHHRIPPSLLTMELSDETELRTRKRGGEGTAGRVWHSTPNISQCNQRRPI